MAEQTIISVSLKEYRDQIKKLQEEMLNLQKGTAEYNKAAESAREKQAKLKEVLADTKNVMDGEEGSLNKLRSQLSQLTKEAATMDVGSDRFKAASKNILELTNRIKDAEESQGNFRRNVGNYANSVESALNKLGLSAKGLGPLFSGLTKSLTDGAAKGKGALASLGEGVKGFGTALKSLAANPIGAIIMAIVVAVKLLKAAFNAVKESIARNEEAFNALQQALVPVKAAIQWVTNVFDQMVENFTKGLAVIGNLITEFMEYTGIIDGAAKKEQEFVDKQKELQELKRNNIRETAKMEYEASEARAKAADKENYTAEQRLQFARDYLDKEQQILEKQKDEAERELQLLQIEAARGKNNAEMNDKLAEAEAKLWKISQAFEEKKRSSAKETSRLQSEIAKDEEDAQKKITDIINKKNAAIKESTDAYNGVISKVRNYYKTSVTLAVAALEEQEAKDEAILEKHLELKLITRKEYDEEVVKLENYYNDQISKIYSDEAKKQDAFLKGINKNFLDESQKSVQAIQDQWNSLSESIIEANKNGLISDEQVAEYVQKIEKAKDEALKELADTAKQNELFDSILQKIEPSQTAIDELKGKIITAFTNGTIDEDQSRELLASLGLSPEAIDTAITTVKERIQELELVETFDSLTSSLSSFAATLDGSLTVVGEGIANLLPQIANMTNAIKKGENGWKNYAQIAAASLGGVAQMLTGLAQEEEGNTKESFKRKQGLEIAATTMNMASGILTAFTTAMELGPIAGPIVGAALSAVIAGLGIA